MHVAFLTNPASGEINVQLATAKHLLLQGHKVTFLAAETCRSKIEKLDKQDRDLQPGTVHFCSLGSGKPIDDFTPYVQDRMAFMRRAPGDPSSLETCIEAALGDSEEHAAVALDVKDKINRLDPDMICVDTLATTLITGVRLTKRKYLLTIPCSAGLTALPGAFSPHAVAKNRNGSWGTLFENMYLWTHEFFHARTNKDRVAKRKILTKRFGLPSYGKGNDTWLLPPHWKDENCLAGIHFNTPGLIDCPKQSNKLIFVGAGVDDFTPKATTSCPEVAWMDEAQLLGEDVVYMNMGSMFIWNKAEFDACIEGFTAVYNKMHGRVRFLFKINFPLDASRGFAVDELPSYIRLTNWIDNQHAVYSHPALKAFIHHGGGNSFNEAVYFGVPQLVMSQWLDTHELADCAVRFGLGLRSGSPPWIVASDIEAKLLRLLGTEWAAFKATCQSWAVRSQIAGGASSASKIIIGYAESGALENLPTLTTSTPQMEKGSFQVDLK